jgi:hypothetical protein
VARVEIRVIEVRFPDGRRLRPDRVEQAVAKQAAKRFAREEQDKLGSIRPETKR